MGTSKLLSSKEYYDAIAGEYALLKNKRKAYLDKVDSIIINDFSRKARNILDVGAGDGLRGIKIFKNVEADTICLVEESNEMIKQVDPLEGVDIHMGGIQYFQSQRNFDLILCLWNVFGHIPTFRDRVLVLKSLKGLLSSQGRIVIDFNNRYNYRQYGLPQVVRNMVRSLFNNQSGWFDLKNKDGSVHGKVYIHSYFEIKRMVAQAGLHVAALKIIDYDSGEIQSNLFQGQYLFYLQK